MQSLQSNDNDIRLDAMAYLSECLPHPPLTPERSRIYLQQLSDLPLVQFLRAALWCADNLEYFPTMRRLRLAALETNIQPCLYTVDEAWEEVLDALETWRAYAMPSFSHRIINESVQAIGWFMLGIADEDNLAHYKRKFAEAYQERIKEQADKDLRLYGSTENLTAVIRSNMKALAGGK